MIKLNRGPNVYYEFIDRSEAQEQTVPDDFYKCALPITSEKGLVNTVIESNDSGLTEAEFGEYKRNFIDYALYTGKQITNSGVSTLFTRIASGKEAYKVVDVYIDSENQEILRTFPTFKNVTPTNLYNKGEDVFDDDKEDYKVYEYDRNMKPSLKYDEDNNLLDSDATDYSYKYDYLFSIQTFKPTNFNEFILRIDTINNSDKSDIRENSELSDEEIDNKFIKLNLYNGNYVLLENFIGSIESGLVDLEGNDYYITERINQVSNFIYINGITTVVGNISTNIFDSVDISFSNNNITQYDHILNESGDQYKVFNPNFNYYGDVDNYLSDTVYRYNDFGVFDNESTVVSTFDEVSGYDYLGDKSYLVKEKCKSADIKRDVNLNINSADIPSSSYMDILLNEDEGVLDTGSDIILNSTSIENTFNIVLSDVNDNNSIYNKAETYTYTDNTDNTVDSFVDDVNIEGTSGSFSINDIVQTVSFNNYSFNFSDSTFQNIDNEVIENIKLELVNIIKSKLDDSTIDIIDDSLNIVVNGELSLETSDVSGYEYQVSLFDEETGALKSGITLTVEFKVQEVSKEIVSDINDMDSHYTFYLKNFNNRSLNANVDNYSSEDLKDIYNTGKASVFFEDRNVNFFYLVDSVVKDDSVWENHQSSLNSLIDKRSDSRLILYSKNFTNSDIVNVNETFENTGQLDTQNKIKVSDFDNFFTEIMGDWVKDRLDDGSRANVPLLGSMLGKWMNRIKENPETILAGVDSHNRVDKKLNVYVNEEYWDLIDKLRVNIPVKLRDVGTYIFFNNTTHGKNSDLKVNTNVNVLVYLIKTYYPILIKHINKRYVDTETQTNYITRMINEMREVLDGVSNAFAEEPEITLDSTAEELNNGIIVLKHVIKFAGYIKAINVRFVFEKTGSFYVDVLEE